MYSNFNSFRRYWRRCSLWWNFTSVAVVSGRAATADSAATQCRTPATIVLDAGSGGAVAAGNMPAAKASRAATTPSCANTVATYSRKQPQRTFDSLQDLWRRAAALQAHRVWSPRCQQTLSDNQLENTESCQDLQTSWWANKPSSGSYRPSQSCRETVWRGPSKQPRKQRQSLA